MLNLVWKLSEIYCVPNRSLQSFRGNSSLNTSIWPWLYDFYPCVQSTRRTPEYTSFNCHVNYQHIHDDVIKWKCFPRYWPFVRGIHRSPLNSMHKGQWRAALMFSLIYAWMNGWVNTREAGVHNDVKVMHQFIVPNLSILQCMLKFGALRDIALKIKALI